MSLNNDCLELDSVSGDVSKQFKYIGGESESVSLSKMLYLVTCIHSFKMYTALLQGNYSETLPTPVWTKR